MASLATLLSTRLAGVVEETNLETGKIYTYVSGKTYESLRCNFCWSAPSAGTVTVEIWGAGGSGARQCCCGIGIPGNSGAYSKKTYSTAADGYICGILGVSCGNANSLCFRGCSTATCIQLCSGTGGTCTCMCAMGGRGGWVRCNPGSGSNFCCLGNQFSLPKTNIGGGGCGIVCNYNDSAQAIAYGGDVNIEGAISCAHFYHCNGSCNCSTYMFFGVPAGRYVNENSIVQSDIDGHHYHAGGTGGGNADMSQSLAAHGRNGQSGYPYTMGSCWNSGRHCQCYENDGCAVYAPPGFPGASAETCSNVRHHGFRGGHGAVRIRFVGS